MCTSFLAVSLLTMLTLKTAQTKPLKESFDPPDASLLQVASIKDMALKQGRIYKKEPDFKFRLQNVSREATENHFCPSYVELTIDFNRRPAIVLQTKCDCNDCLAYGELESSGVCKEMMYFKAVEVRGKGHLYQAFTNSCYCDLVKNILPKSQL